MSVTCPYTSSHGSSGDGSENGMYSLHGSATLALHAQTAQVNNNIAPYHQPVSDASALKGSNSGQTYSSMGLTASTRNGGPGSSGCCGG